MALIPGTRLGPYEVTAQIGAGGMGEVYRAHDTKLRRDVAIKILPAAFASDRERIARFSREAQALAALNHPHIAQIYGFEETDHARALIMEFVDGEDLAERLKRGPIPVEDGLPIARQVAEALEAAHEQGIIHRDLKPANIKLRSDGMVKVLDLGLAKALDPISAVGLDVTSAPTVTPPAVATNAGMILGTAAYMSPEQARGKAVDRRGDLWAFGCVLYEMLTGKPAFSGETLTDIVAAVVKNEPDWDALPAATPALVRSLLRRCLQKDPARRLQHAGDARVEIEEATAEPAVRPSPISAKRPQRWMAPLLPWAIAALVSLALVSQMRVGPSGSAAPAVVRLDLNMPAGVEVATTSSPMVTISADGGRIAFVGATDGLRRVYVRRFDDPETTQLRGTETGSICFFSPDGQTIAFITTDRILKKVSLADGGVTSLATDVDYSSAGGGWGVDDRIVFARRGTLWEIPGSGAEPARQLTSLDRDKGERAHVWPILVAGAKTVLFTTVTTGSQTLMRIEALVRATGERRVVVDSASYPMYASSGHLVFFRDNTLLAAPFDLEALRLTGPATAVVENIALDQFGAPMAALAANGTLAHVIPESARRRLVWVSRQGVESPITDTPRPYQNPRLAPDGNRILVEINGGHLWLQDVTRSTFTRITSAETIGNTFATWVPHSQRVVFRTLTGMWMIDPNGGSAPQPLTGTSVNDIPTSVSPDGRTLMFIRQAAERSGDLYTMALDGSSEPRSVVSTQGYDGGGQFSGDGRWLAYVSNESGQSQVYVRPYPGPDRKFPVSTQGGTHPKWNRNGKELFYRDGNKMMVVDVSTRAGDPVPDLSPPRVLFEQRYAFGGAQTIPNYDVSPDGQRFVMVKDDSASGRLNVVLNWTEELKARVPLK